MVFFFLDRRKVPEVLLCVSILTNSLIEINIKSNNLCSDCLSLMIDNQLSKKTCGNIVGQPTKAKPVSWDSRVLMNMNVLYYL